MREPPGLWDFERVLVGRGPGESLLEESAETDCYRDMGNRPGQRRLRCVHVMPYGVHCRRVRRDRGDRQQRRRLRPCVCLRRMGIHAGVVVADRRGRPGCRVVLRTIRAVLPTCRRAGRRGGCHRAGDRRRLQPREAEQRQHTPRQGALSPSHPVQCGIHCTLPLRSRNLARYPPRGKKSGVWPRRTAASA